MPAPPSTLAPTPGLPGDEARAWHGGWALGLGALAALLLLLSPSAPPGGLVAGLLLAALPGAWGALPLRPVVPARLAVWTVCAVVGVAIAAGPAGPLLPVLAAPALAALVLGAGRRGAAALAAVATAASVLLGHARGSASPIPEPWLAAGALLVVAVAAAYAVGRSRPPPAAPAEEPSPLQAQLAEAQAARAVAEARAEGRARFIAQMSHELRTPLNAILGFSDIMRSRLFGPLTDRYAEYAQLIHESGGHLLELINDVLDLSKIEADRYELRLERFDVREAVNDAMRLLRGQAEEAGVALRSLPPTQSLEVDADRRAIKQIVLNLVSNALKFTPRGGAVDVILRAVEGGLEIVVSDTGVGIAPEDLARLGDAYAQAPAGRETEGAAQGTGLGLSLVKAFARLHGGDLSLESRLGEGTAATVRLPVLAAAG